MSAKFPRGGSKPILSHPSNRKDRSCEVWRNHTFLKQIFDLDTEGRTREREGRERGGGIESEREGGRESERVWR